jgi:hypothetical protein
VDASLRSAAKSYEKGELIIPSEMIEYHAVYLPSDISNLFDETAHLQRQAVSWRQGTSLRNFHLMSALQLQTLSHQIFLILERHPIFYPSSVSHYFQISFPSASTALMLSTASFVSLSPPC